MPLVSRRMLGWLLAALMFLAACSGGAGDSAGTDVGPDNDSRPSDSAEVVEPAAVSAVALSQRQLEFRVRVPKNHPLDEPVMLMTMPPGNVAALERIEMDPVGDGVYEATATVERGALLRYTYDHWDGVDLGEWSAKRETVGGVFDFVNRYVLVTDELDIVEDTVAVWRDLPGPQHTGAVSGRVLDAVTREPVIDATVSVSGVHVASDWQGRFRVANLPEGVHRAVVFTTLGDHVAAQVEFDLGSLPDGEIEILLEPARPVPVSFDVALPRDTPLDAEIAIAGNVWQLGGRLTGYPFQPTAVALPVLDRVAPDRATATIELYEGTYVAYTYTFRSVAEGADRDDAGPVYRSFIVDAAESDRFDVVERWPGGDWPITTLRVAVPTNTTPGVPIGIVTGPTAWMTQTGPYEWAAQIVDSPPGSEFEFGLTLGDDMFGRDGSPGTVDGRRTVTIPDGGGDLAMTVTKWEALPDPTPRRTDGGLDVTFRVSVPPETPSDAVIRLTGDRPAVGGGVVLEQVPGNPWLYEATVGFGHDGDLAYTYQLDGAGESTRTYSVFTEYDGQVVNDWVGEWGGLSRDDADARSEWRSGIYLPDFWSVAFADASESAFERIRTVAEGDWVVVSSVWSFGQLQPTPTIESRPVQRSSVLTPKESIVAQAAQAHAAGLRVLLAPQQNPEVIPGWNDPPLNVRDRAWWEAWLAETERQWMWNAIVAEEIGAEMLLLPGPVFHVFPDAGQFDGDPFQQEFDTRVAALVEQVRGVYGGSLMISGSNRAYDFPGLADVRGVTTYDLSIPQLTDEATVEQWKEAYRARFEAVVDPIRRRWDGPVVFYTIHAPATASGEAPPPGDPFGEYVQASRLEAIYQLIAERPWIEGAFSWSYDYIDAPQRLADGVRGRLAEAVQAKWYDRLSSG